MVQGRPDGRVAVVTGGARGVGEATARHLARRGLRLALLGRELDTLRQVADSLPTQTCCIEVDVTDEAALQGAACSVQRRLGPASVVVANAGIAAAGLFADTDTALFDRVINVNLLGSANTARAFLPQLRRTGGYFLQIASTAAFGSAPLMSAYCASKAGVESFAQALRTELHHQGVDVGIAYLHWTGTDMIGGIDDHPVLRALRTHQPSPARRVHSPDQVAAWLVRGINKRATSVYAPPWLRLVEPLRPLLPSIVSRVARRSLADLPAAELHSNTGVLGAGGRADWESHRPAPPLPPVTPPQC
ncbi:SDR family oxidoreductase [Streptomyces sp. M41(2017)]|uniref:SDR family oxidoreductase n=1 Tax=unclassified Streptomyces TaxID=2593676 RepID=UPI0009BDEBA4|nr:SDR family oxidoreductase [Streptomyces sp. M41(2017)]OQQ19900.1 short-chain dehydrogenase [Streptomyces sp. M41(2017)]